MKSLTHYYHGARRRLMGHIGPKVRTAMTEWGDNMEVIMPGGYPIWQWGHLSDYEYSLQKFIELHLKPDDTFVDAGAHVGYFSVLANHLCREVYAFEPTPEVFEVLKRNAHGRNIKTRNYALSDINGSIFMFSHKIPGSGANSKYFNRGNAVKSAVRTIRLDDVVPKADFIKIDVEGMEFEILRGAERILRECHPVVAAEALEETGMVLIGRMCLYMEELGYTTYQLSKEGLISRYYGDFVPQSNMLIFNFNLEKEESKTP